MLLETLLDGQPDNVRGRYTLAMALKHNYRIAEARDQFSAVLQRQPDHAPAMIELGGCLQRENKVDDAMIWYGKAFRSNRGNFASIIKTMTSIPYGRFSADYRQMRRVLEKAGV